MCEQDDFLLHNYQEFFASPFECFLSKPTAFQSIITPQHANQLFSMYHSFYIGLSLIHATLTYLYG